RVVGQRVQLVEQFGERERQRQRLLGFGRRRSRAFVVDETPTASEARRGWRRGRRGGRGGRGWERRVGAQQRKAAHHFDSGQAQSPGAAPQTPTPKVQPH